MPMRRPTDDLGPAAEPLLPREGEPPTAHRPLRVLFTTIPATGHFQPLVPFARGLAAAGHTVAFATTPDFVAAIEASGFSCFAVGVPKTPGDVLRERGIDHARLSPEEAVLEAVQWFFLGDHKRREIDELLGHGSSQAAFLLTVRAGRAGNAAGAGERP
jgi:hypothetical protein